MFRQLAENFGGWISVLTLNESTGLPLRYAELIIRNEEGEDVGSDAKVAISFDYCQRRI